MARLADRFEANVDRSGDHDVWTGSKKADGTGKRSTGARSRRHGSRGSSPTGRCQRERRSSRAPTSGPASASTPLPAPAGHGRRPDTAAAGAEGLRTKLEVPPGVWKLTMTAGRWVDGTPRRVHRTVRAESPSEAAQALADFAAEVRSAPLPQTRNDRGHHRRRSGRALPGRAPRRARARSPTTVGL
jgi:hypothetical protein